MPAKKTYIHDKKVCLKTFCKRFAYLHCFCNSNFWIFGKYKKHLRVRKSLYDSWNKKQKTPEHNPKRKPKTCKRALKPVRKTAQIFGERDFFQGFKILIVKMALRKNQNSCDRNCQNRKKQAYARIRNCRNAKSIIVRKVVFRFVNPGSSLCVG